MHAMFAGDNIATHMSSLFDGESQTRSVSANEEVEWRGGGREGGRERGREGERERERGREGGREGEEGRRGRTCSIQVPFLLLSQAALASSAAGASSGPEQFTSVVSHTPNSDCVCVRGGCHSAAQGGRLLP